MTAQIETMTTTQSAYLFPQNFLWRCVRIALLCVGISACNTHEHDHTEPVAASGGGDDYWAALAQNYEPFVKPPELSPAYPPEAWSSVGSWEPTFDMPLIATAAANLPDGRIVAWSSQEVDTFGGDKESTVGTIFNPVDGSFEDTPNSTHDMFCAGLSMLEDGRVFVAGGGATVVTTSIFDNDEFSTIEPMAIPRWYPTSTTLASGQVLASLGTIASPYPEIWTDGSGWTLLPSIDLQTILDTEDVVHNDWYPALTVAPDGSLFHPGHMPGLLSVHMEQHDTVQHHGEREADEVSRLYNTTVMYDIGKMLIAGGGSQDNATNTALLMDLNGPEPVVTPTTPMKHVRSMQNSVVLPNGEVLVIGGNSSGIQFSDDGTVLEPELWNPDTEQWTPLALHDKPRNYHSIAILLKDGRVLAAGGGLCGGCPTNHQNGEIFSPPYLFDAQGLSAPRPTISGGAATALPGETVTLTGSDDIVEFNMLRLVAITHHHTTDQRFVPVDFIKTDTGTYDLTMNSNPNVLIPGYYWVFGLNADGTPTEGHTLQVNVAPEIGAALALSDNEQNVEYDYYEDTWVNWELPDFDTLAPKKSGFQSDFSLFNKDRSNQYAFRFRATLHVPSDGEYTFFLKSDDGSKLFINNNLVVDHDGAHAYNFEESGTITLTKGQHDIEVHYFELAGGDALLASWQGPDGLKRPINSVDLGSPIQPKEITYDNPGPSIAGKVSYRYYEGAWTTLPDFGTQTIIKEGEVDGFLLSPRLQDDLFGFEFTAEIQVPVSGEYTFFTTSDDGSRLYINDRLVVDNDGIHAPTEQSGTIRLAEGTHKIKVEYFEQKRGETLQVHWQGPSFAKEIIPTSVLSSNGSVDTGNTTQGSSDSGTTDGESDAGTTAGSTDTGSTNGISDSGTTGGSGDSDTTDSGTEDVGISGLVNYNYYQGAFTKLPDFNALTAVKQGQSPGFVLDDREQDDFYAFRFSGAITIPSDGTYTFYLKSDDGSRLLLNGEVVVLNDFRHPPIEKQADIVLTAGTYSIDVEFFEYGGGHLLDVAWSSDTFNKEPIPLAVLSTGKDDPAPDVEEPKISYQYFEGQWAALPDFTSLTPINEGHLNAFSLEPKATSDNYAFRYASYLDIPEDGTYTFYVASDDGSALSIDGQLLVDNDGLHAKREVSASQTLSAGQHHVLIEFFERAGQDSLEVFWSSDTMPKQALANATLTAAPFNDGANTDDNANDNVDGDTTGGSTVTPPSDSDLNYEYYEGNWTVLPDFNQLTPTSSGSTPQFTLPDSNGVKFYGYRFTGKILIPETDLYTFYTASNDGSQLLINGITVVDNNGKHGVIEKQGAVSLDAGLHDIEVRYFQSNGTEALDVYWSSANIAKQIIGDSVLFSPE